MRKGCPGGGARRLGVFQESAGVVDGLGPVGGRGGGYGRVQEIGKCGVGNCSMPATWVDGSGRREGGVCREHKGRHHTSVYNTR